MRAADAAVERRLGNGAQGDPVEEAAFEVFEVELSELERLERELSHGLGERHPLTIELGRAAGSLVALENDLSEGREIELARPQMSQLPQMPRMPRITQMPQMSQR